jgi:RNA polymerase sigma-70 factor, ECF subfamily
MIFCAALNLLRAVRNAPCMMSPTQARANVASRHAIHYHHHDAMRIERAARGMHIGTPRGAVVMNTEDELDLIRKVAEGDRAAFEQLYYLYAPRLARYLGKFLRTPHAVEEAINDVMLVVWRSAARFDPQAARLSTWMFGIAHNKALKSMQRAGRHAAEVSYDADDSPELSGASFAQDAFARSAPDDPARAAQGKQFGVLLAWALEQLSHEHRSVIELAFGQECPYEEIAHIMQCPVNTVKTRVFHARKKLAQLLASRGVDHAADFRG